MKEKGIVELIRKSKNAQVDRQELSRAEFSLERGMALVSAIVRVAEDESLSTLGDKNVMIVLDEAWGHLEETRKSLELGVAKAKEEINLKEKKNEKAA